MKEPQAEIRALENFVGIFMLNVESDADDLKC